MLIAAAGQGGALWSLLMRGGLPEGAVAREIAALAGLPAYPAPSRSRSRCWWP